MVSSVHTLGDSTLDNLYWLLNGRGTNLEEALANCTDGKNHDFEAESQIYAKTGDHYVGSPNRRGWSVAYPRA